jgi:hypothetical protein
MVFATRFALLIAAVGLAVLTETGEATALRTAVAMSAIASLANGEGGAALGKSASPEIKNHFAAIRHACFRRD